MEKQGKMKRYPDLSSFRPDVAEQWHSEKNGPLLPRDVTAMSGRRVWWICPKGHEWQATVASRSSGVGCPICSGKKVLKGYNDLATVAPELAAQWHPTKNGTLRPDSVTKGSGEKAWWVCEKGHEWQAVISSRSAGCGCPKCNSSTSFAEQALYFYISQFYQAENRYRFMKKELDIYLPEFQIAVEHDGPCHLQKEVQQADARKDALLRENGVYLIRVKDPFPFSVDEERSIIYYTYDEKRHEDLERAIRETLRLISLRTGKDWAADIDISRDEAAIRDQYKAYESKRSIFAKVSEAKAYWDWEKNTLNPLYLTYGNDQRVHWKCSYGHQWTSSASAFSSGGRCPVCRGRRVLAGFNDLAAVSPDLAQEWHPFKNGSLNPDQVTVRSGRRVWWQCAQGHEWQATVANRSGGHGCPVCAGRRVLAGYNDLATRNPDLASEWHPAKNGDVGPEAVTEMSQFKAWWICREGHEWRAEVSSRSQGNGCPYCAGKKVLAGFNDLSTTNPKLAAQWHPTKNGSLGPDGVTAYSGKRVWWQCPQGHAWEAAISYRSGGSGCPYCSGRVAVPGKTDLRTVCPELVKEWHPTQNGNLKPESFTRMSEKKVWWRCINGHSWKSAISNRTSGSGCPYCSGRQAVRGYNDFLTLHPELALEWNYEKNTGVYPFDVLEYSNRKVWWKCSKGHEWKAVIGNRTAGSGCPICTGRKVQEGYNDLQTIRPDLAGQWHPDKNGSLTPRQITAGSSKKVWWLCRKGHEWQATVANRAQGTGCPICADRKVAPGVNDFASAHPDLAAQWHTEKNGALGPEYAAKTSRTKVWWICKNGHEWQASVGDRSRGYGCPYCSGKLPIVGVNDLATAAPKLAVEWHPEKNGTLTPRDVKPYSNRKVWWRCKMGHEWQAAINSRFAGNGCARCSGRRADVGSTDLATTHPQLCKEWIISRNPGITPQDVTKGSERKIWWRCQKGHEWQTSVCNRVKGSGCPVCSGRKVMEGYNDLATARADLAREWHPEKNRTDVTPHTVSPGSHYKAWWRCSRGHEWQAAVSSRVQGAGCPFCAGKRVLRGFNDLATLRPEIAAQWHSIYNEGLTPQEVTQHSGKKIWWICERGHEWQTTVDARSRGAGCPICAGKRARPAPVNF